MSGGAPAAHLRPAVEADLPRLGSLFAERFGRPFSRAEWEWKYRQSPGASRSWVAEGQGGELLAHAGALGLPARWRGGAGLAWQLVDFMGTTRGHGLRAPMTDLGRALLAELPAPGDAPFLFGFPSERHFRLGAHAFGYRPLGRLGVLAASLAAAGMAARPTADSGALDLVVGDTAPADAEELWARCTCFGVRRTTAFLNWRYHARPERYYRFYRVASGAAAGFVVVAFVGREAWVTEAWLPAGRGLGAVWPAIAADLRASGLESWQFWDLPAGVEPPPPGLDRIDEVFTGYRAAADPSHGAVPPAALSDFALAMGDHDIR